MNSKKRWCEAMKLYDLEENEWLQELFVERHMWVPAYMKEYFWAGMKTMQRVEIINRFFDGFVNRHTKLYEFPEKYSQALKKRVDDEIDADDRDRKYIRRLVSVFKVERFFQKIYTNAKFQEVQRECARMLYVVPKVEDIISATAIQYLIEDRVWIRKSGTNKDVVTEWYKFYSVTFNPVTKECSCDCRKFEKDGILCRHVIRVWDQNKVKDIPPKYVISRWRKDVVRRHTRFKVAYHDPSQIEECKRYNTLLPDLESLCEEAFAVDDDTVETVRAAVKKLREEVRASRAKLMENTALPKPATTPSSTPTHQSTPQAFTPRSTHSHQSTPQAITPRSTHQASPHAVTPNTGCARPNPNISKGSTTNNDRVKDPIIKKKTSRSSKGILEQISC
ncbi:protein FAR-RED ELONGATED HYPOCOTYL 3-like [Chenopodium quinoa]|uniref:protein FAR-RED ELONGATED HYPOCOTYL 3-like n=1 Tax=Chenopodium quinoa TaxID=63459 RepID=UPI000B790D75|nr:protein FAR-RED ELONGATED HYPOCOTYL 3-like [Chenopodium quinoa]XP_021724131.1 protein FAR-RED ELONGATED HYPOCOTYL 3-like [Chenopodium quinoa]XP_021724132.1 protein FAR-RED ELONGATED HYPOCOTYL 3-like [Chenopodium quinoa]